jgi:glycosyltransferase involved in cell wall biosynthesis
MANPASALVSVIVPARNEAKNLDTLVDEIHTALKSRAHEIIVVDDASTDETESVLKTKRGAGVPVRHIRHAKALGQSGAVRTGVWAAKGDVIATLDGDGQNNPSYFPALLEALERGGPKCGLAMGRRLKRTDGTLKKYASRFANKVRGGLLKDGAKDSGCGLKVLPADLFRRLPFFDGWHRFIPALVSREGYSAEWVEVVDRPRGHGKSNYGIFDRGFRGVLDLFGVWWIKKRFRGVAETTEVM